mmetsp:Transcript_8098/g.11777  ORF Transcript_8098/g.11777 Transcript_8098/m.11777 type:complete len:84 (+) Transcript_8098:310-561(+)
MVLCMIIGTDDNRISNVTEEKMSFREVAHDGGDDDFARSPPRSRARITRHMPSASVPGCSLPVFKNNDDSDDEEYIPRDDVSH